MNDSDSAKQRPQRFSMLRTFALADVLTLANGFCGAGSILALMEHIATNTMGWLWLAIALLPIALFLDFADGRVARWRHRSSPLGADLDSLADVISFGMAPAALGFAVGLRSSLDVAILLYFVACGISRLARFNVTAATMSDESGKVRYFEGTPIPTSVLIVGMWGWLAAQDRIGDSMLFGLWDFGMVALHPLSLIYFLSGSLMISTLRIPKL
ncbi:MAG TPA: CDP-alcohol phosphatidyltransferase family protein [Polyangiales bacterium]|nr:CDP-alcohol phosphatidyltransferase family protein [Polyangiales bacterium]